MLRLRSGSAFISLVLTAIIVNAQPAQRALPSYLRGVWTTQKVSFGGINATIRLPEGWSIQEGGVSVPDAGNSDCHIDFALKAGNYEQRLAQEVEEDRKISRYGMHSELSRAGGVRLVSVQYTDGPERLIEKRYFELPSDNGNSLLEWILKAQSTEDGHDCASRFSVVAESFRLVSNP